MTNNNFLLKLKIIPYIQSTQKIPNITYTITLPYIKLWLIKQQTIKLKSNNTINMANPLKSNLNNFLYYIPKLIKYWQIPNLIVSYREYQLLQFYWTIIITKLIKSRRTRKTIQYFKINIFHITQTFFSLIFQQKLVIWQTLAIALYRAKPSQQRFIILKFIHFFLYITSIITPYANIQGYLIKIRGKINRAGSVRRKQLKFFSGQRSLFNKYLSFNKQHYYFKTPAGVLGLTVIIFYKVKYVLTRQTKKSYVFF